MAAGMPAVLNMCDIHTGGVHFITQPPVLGIAGTYVSDSHTGTGKRDGLVGPFSAQHPAVAKGRHRFTGSGKMRHLIKQVYIDGTKIENCHNGV
jgi:hypothetical protein